MRYPALRCWRGWNKFLTPALEGAYLCLLYPARPRHPKQKYRLTPRGCLVWDKLHG